MSSKKSTSLKGGLTRPIEQFDLSDVLELERSFNKTFAITETELIEIIRQRPSIKKGTYESRVMVSEDDDGQVLGAFAYEIQNEVLEVIWWAVHPLHLPLGLALMCVSLERVCRKKSKTFFLWVKDHAVYDLGSILPLFQRKKSFKINLVPNQFDNIDAWRVTWVDSV